MPSIAQAGEAVRLCVTRRPARLTGPDTRTHADGPGAASGHARSSNRSSSSSTGRDVLTSGGKGRRTTEATARPLQRQGGARGGCCSGGCSRGGCSRGQGRLLQWRLLQGPGAAAAVVAAPGARGGCCRDGCSRDQAQSRGDAAGRAGAGYYRATRQAGAKSHRPRRGVATSGGDARVSLGRRDAQEPRLAGPAGASRRGRGDARVPQGCRDKAGRDVRVPQGRREEAGGDARGLQGRREEAGGNARGPQGRREEVGATRGSRRAAAAGVQQPWRAGYSLRASVGLRAAVAYGRRTGALRAA
ncbi:unnamed protein product [Closterium sp. NIES-65]|nr:unnamed protein product [Closterium sp. NIES-65]